MMHVDFVLSLKMVCLVTEKMSNLQRKRGHPMSRMQGDRCPFMLYFFFIIFMLFFLIKNAIAAIFKKKKLITLESDRDQERIKRMEICLNGGSKFFSTAFFILNCISLFFVSSLSFGFSILTLTRILV